MPDLSTLTNRDMLGTWLNEQGLLGVGLEVGSLSGEYARQIMKHWNGDKLLMVDPWETQPDHIYKEPVNHTDWGECYRSCMALANEYSGRIELIRGYSPEVSGYFKGGTLDWVYIDGNHGLEHITADLDAWWPKVVKGGLFGGHDLRDDLVFPQNCSVLTAVTQFAIDKELAIHHTPPCGSWWIIKP